MEEVFEEGVEETGLLELVGLLEDVGLLEEVGLLDVLGLSVEVVVLLEEPLEDVGLEAEGLF